MKSLIPWVTCRGFMEFLASVLARTECTAPTVCTTFLCPDSFGCTTYMDACWSTPISCLWSFLSRHSPWGRYCGTVHTLWRQLSTVLRTGHFEFAVFLTLPYLLVGRTLSAELNVRMYLNVNVFESFLFRDTWKISRNKITKKGAKLFYYYFVVSNWLEGIWPWRVKQKFDISGSQGLLNEKYDGSKLSSVDPFRRKQKLRHV